MARIGPSSPHVPYEMMASPMGVPSRLRSLRIGMSVPRAVVVSAITVAMPLMPCFAKNGSRVTTSDDPCDKADFALMSGESFRVDFVAGEQE